MTWKCKKISRTLINNRKMEWKKSMTRAYEPFHGTKFISVHMSISSKLSSKIPIGFFLLFQNSRRWKRYYSTTRKSSMSNIMDSNWSSSLYSFVSYWLSNQTNCKWFSHKHQWLKLSFIIHILYDTKRERNVFRVVRSSINLEQDSL